MEERYRESFTKIMLGLGEVFDKQVSEVLLSIYWEALKPYPWKKVKDALNKAVVTCRFFPKPVDIIELITGADKTEEQAEKAWTTLLDAIKQHGPYVSVIFEDGRIARCIELMGGWEEVNSWKTSELQFRRKDFLSIYRSLPEMGPAKVFGILEKENSARNFLRDPKFTDSPALAPTVRVGEKQKKTKAEVLKLKEAV